jgi:hypothetical protein
MLGKLIGNALNRAFVRLDASLLGQDASPTTRSPLFLKNCISTHSFIFLSLLSARLPPPSARPLALLGAACGRLRGAALGHWPCQARRAATSEPWRLAAGSARRVAAALSKSHGRGLPAAHAVDASLPRCVGM